MSTFYETLFSTLEDRRILNEKFAVYLTGSAALRTAVAKGIRKHHASTRVIFLEGKSATSLDHYTIHLDDLAKYVLAYPEFHPRGEKIGRMLALTRFMFLYGGYNQTRALATELAEIYSQHPLVHFVESNNPKYLHDLLNQGQNARIISLDPTNAAPEDHEHYRRTLTPYFAGTPAVYIDSDNWPKPESLQVFKIESARPVPTNNSLSTVCLSPVESEKPSSSRSSPHAVNHPPMQEILLSLNQTL